MERNDVTSFFYYMWNSWGEDECRKVFTGSGCGWRHIWEKWVGLCNQVGSSSAIPHFYADIDTQLRDMLVERATSLYNGRSRI